MSATVAAAVKAAIVILSNEEARKKVGWGIVAILSPLIVLVVLLCAILSGTSQHNVSAVELCFHGGSISAITPMHSINCPKVIPESISPGPFHSL